MQEWPAAEKEGRVDAIVQHERQLVLKGRPLGSMDTVVEVWLDRMKAGSRP